MAQIQEPYELRDMSRGVIRKANLAPSLVPPNSVAHAINFDFANQYGVAVGRPGTTLVGSQIAANKSVLGLFEFVTGGQVINDLIAIVAGASNATLYYSSGSTFTASSLTTLSNTAKVRFATLNGRCYLANGSDNFQFFTDPSGSFTNVTFGGTTPVTIKPTLLLTVKNRMLASGATATNRSRVYFSSVVDPTASPGITWNTDAATGDWIDVNPDDGDDVTALQYTSGLVLTFKRNAFYRIDAINKTVDLNNVYPYGAASQEGTVNCNGMVYFFTGRDIRRTNGGFPEKISTLIQEWVDAIGQSSWTSVAAGTDGDNVYFSIGNVTVPAAGKDAIAYTNIVLKFSTIYENWSIYSYKQQSQVYCNFTTSTNGRKMISGDSGGNVQTVGVGTTDNTSPIFFDLQTQEIDFGNRAHDKEITDLVAVYMNYGQGMQLFYKEDDGDFKSVSYQLTDRVNEIDSFQADGNFFTFRVTGSSTQKAPVFEGLYFERIIDRGITYA